MMFVLRSHQLDGAAMPESSPDIEAHAPEAEYLTLHHPVVSEVLGRRNRPDEAGPSFARPVEERPTVQAGRWHGAAILPPYASTFAVRFGGAKAAGECPKHIADTQALIDRISDRMARDEHRMQIEVAELVYALLDDARMLLEAARQNHEQPRNAFDHARAYAKTDAALGHARAAEILHSRCSHPQGCLASMPRLRA
jgi:hypothetical protein